MVSLSFVFVSLLVSYCSPFVSADETTCRICSDGSAMTKPSSTVVIPAEEDFGGVVEPAVTCGDLMVLASSSDGIESCDSLQVAAAAKCGCPAEAVKPDCPLCTSGGSALPTPDFLDAPIDGFLTSSKTCFDLLLEAAESRSDEECTSAQTTAVLFCGCPAINGGGGGGSDEEGGSGGGGGDIVVGDGEASADGNCTICQDGSSPVATGELPIIPGVTCQVLEATALEGLVSSNLCPGFQATAGLYCGCQDYNLPEEREDDICRLCGAQTPLPEPSRVVELLGVDNLTCAGIELEVNARGDATVSDGNANVTAFLQSGDCAAIRDAMGDACCRTTGTDDNNNAGSTSAAGAGGRSGLYVAATWLWLGMSTAMMMMTTTFIGGAKGAL